MNSQIPTHTFVEILHKVWEPELKQVKARLTDQLENTEIHLVLREAWELAVNEANGLQTISLLSKLWLFPALQESAQAIGRLIFSAWQENAEAVKEAEVTLLRLGRSKLVIQTRRHLKRARAIVLLRSLGSAIRRQDREAAAWLAQSLQGLGYACEVAVVWHSNPTLQQASA